MFKREKAFQSIVSLNPCFANLVCKTMFTLLVLLGLVFTVAARREAPESSVIIKEKLVGVDQIHLFRQESGEMAYYLTYDDGKNETLTSEQFASLVYDSRVERSWIEGLLNISSPIGIAWVLLGFLGQMLFTGRMIIQWIASEKQKRSTVPVLFWWLSLTGGLMLLTYFIWRKDIVGIIGQSTGAFIYGRNLILIHRQTVES